MKEVLDKIYPQDDQERASDIDGTMLGALNAIKYFGICMMSKVFLDITQPDGISHSDANTKYF